MKPRAERPLNADLHRIALTVEGKSRNAGSFEHYNKLSLLNGGPRDRKIFIIKMAKSRVNLPPVVSPASVVESGEKRVQRHNHAGKRMVRI
jgi:hypothetical protein